MNFLEGGVVANAKEKNIIDDEIFVRRNILRGKKCILVICRKNLILLVILSGKWFQKKQVDI